MDSTTATAELGWIVHPPSGVSQWSPNPASSPRIPGVLLQGLDVPPHLPASFPPSGPRGLSNSPGYKPKAHHLLAVGPLAGGYNSLSLRFLTYKMVMVTTALKSW